MTNLMKRVRKLEQRRPEETEVRKSDLPEWLLEELRPQGLRWDAAGRIEPESLRGITGCRRAAAPHQTAL